MTTKFTLTSTITTHAGKTSVITLNEPKARSFVKHGEPFKLTISPDGTVVQTFDSANSIKFLSDMSGLDELVLEDLSAKDFMALRVAMSNIILSGAGENPTEA